MIEEFATTDELDEMWDNLMKVFEVQAKVIKELTERVQQLEKHSHKPVTFVADENGFLKIAKESE